MVETSSDLFLLLSELKPYKTKALPSKERWMQLSNFAEVLVSKNKGTSRSILGSEKKDFFVTQSLLVDGPSQPLFSLSTSKPHKIKILRSQEWWMKILTKN